MNKFSGYDLRLEKWSDVPAEGRKRGVWRPVLFGLNFISFKDFNRFFCCCWEKNCAKRTRVEEPPRSSQGLAGPLSPAKVPTSLTGCFSWKWNEGGSVSLLQVAGGSLYKSGRWLHFCAGRPAAYIRRYIDEQKTHLPLSCNWDGSKSPANSTTVMELSYHFLVRWHQPVEYFLTII